MRSGRPKLASQILSASDCCGLADQDDWGLVEVVIPATGAEIDRSTKGRDTEVDQILKLIFSNLSLLVQPQFNHSTLGFIFKLYFWENLKKGPSDLGHRSKPSYLVPVPQDGHRCYSRTEDTLEDDELIIERV
jgi:hypothetical protein